LGNDVHDTVELLEAIGRDASLRHASPEALASALDAAGASPGVRELAATGNDAALTAELGLVKLHGEHMSQTGGHEGDGDDHDPAHHPDHDDEGDEDGTASGDDLDAPSP
jgi:hypothetical protein